MKKMMLMLLIAGVAVGAMAQTRKEVKGAVIDKYGNSLPGVKIEATGGAEGTVTDADGTFTLEVSRWLKSLTATYPGMKKKKAKIVDSSDQDILITMNPASNKQWFINSVFQFDLNKEIGTLGLMAGQLGKWGWYGKIALDAINMPPKTHVRPCFSAGLVKRLSYSLYPYFGLGYGKTYVDGWYYTSVEDVLLFDLGLMIPINKVNVNVGLSIGRVFDDFFESSNTDDRQWLQLGLGYKF